MTLLPKLFSPANGPQTRETWEKGRREEIVSLFASQVYGFCPPKDSYQTAFCQLGESGCLEGKGIRRQIQIQVTGPQGEFSFPFSLYLPQTGKPMPVFVAFSGPWEDVTALPQELEKFAPPARFLLEQGFALACVPCPLLAPDGEDCFAQGIFPAFEKDPHCRPADAWGAVAAWGFGASLILDYLETVPEEVQADRAALVGFSRQGKAAAYAGARDPRFFLVIPHNAGCTGTALARGTTGETVKNINDQFPHWFDGNYKQYNGREEEMPFDFHMLLACMAPRLLYVTSSDQDLWCDPPGTFRAWLACREAYALYGLPVPDPADFPQPLPLVDQPVWVGNMAYHVKTGGHSLTLYDWEQFARFFRAHL